MKRIPYLVGFDTEDDGKGNPFLFCFVHERGAWHTKSRGDALYFLRSLAEKLKLEGLQLQAWATNLEYDLVNLFPPGEIADVDFRFGKSALISARWHGVEFRDTIRQFPASVKELGELVGTPKLERDDSVAYCMRDAGITYRAAKMIRDFYRDNYDLEPKMTLASNAYNVWKSHFWKGDVTAPFEEIRELAQAAYFGGRTEPFGIGRFDNVQAIDAASMFPWAMTAGRLPLPWGGFKRVKRGAPILPSGIYRAKVSVPLNVEIPPLPFRSAEGLHFAVGTWIGSYVGEELLAAADLGVEIEVRSGVEFLDTCDPFQDYVSEMFREKQTARGPRRLFYKLLLNALYGKFGQKGQNVRCLSVEKAKETSAWLPEEFKVWNGLIFFTEDGNPPPWSNFVWPAFVTARSRVRLLQEMLKIKRAGARILYCDTDSVIFQAGKARLNRYPEKVSVPGQFESRGRFEEMLIAGKKEYGLRSGETWEIHAKGIPRDSRLNYLTTGKARFTLPVRLREAARRGLQANVWTERGKERKVDFSRRLLTDNSLKRITIRNGGKGKWQRRKLRAS